MTDLGRKPSSNRRSQLTRRQRGQLNRESFDPPSVTIPIAFDKMEPS